MYTAIACKFSTEEAAAHFTAAVQSLCLPYGYQVVINEPDFDHSTSAGIKVFQQKMGINLLLCLNYPSHAKVKVSSDLVFLELGCAAQSKYAGRETHFVELILKVAWLEGPLSLYWIFADEWPQDRFTRLKAGSAVDLIAYLEANGWYWSESLYSVKNGSYHPEFEIPLLFRITS